MLLDSNRSLRFIKFLVAGGLGTFGYIFLSYLISSLGVKPWTASFIAYASMIPLVYSIQRIFVFKRIQSQIFSEVSGYPVVGAIFIRSLALPAESSERARACFVCFGFHACRPCELFLAIALGVFECQIIILVDRLLKFPPCGRPK